MAIVEHIIHLLVKDILLLCLAMKCHHNQLVQTHCIHNYQGMSCNQFFVFIQVNRCKSLVGKVVDMLNQTDRKHLMGMKRK